MAADGLAHPEIELGQKYFDEAYDARAKHAALRSSKRQIRAHWRTARPSQV